LAAAPTSGFRIGFLQPSCCTSYTVFNTLYDKQCMMSSIRASVFSFAYIDRNQLFRLSICLPAPFSGILLRKEFPRRPWHSAVLSGILSQEVLESMRFPLRLCTLFFSASLALHAQ